VCGSLPVVPSDPTPGAAPAASRRSYTYDAASVWPRSRRPQARAPQLRHSRPPHDMTDTVGHTTYGYDTAGVWPRSAVRLPTSSTPTTPRQPGHTMTAAGRTATYTYDPDNRLATVLRAPTSNLRFAYNDDGALATLTPNGVTAPTLRRRRSPRRAHLQEQRRKRSPPTLRLDAQAPHLGHDCGCRPRTTPSIRRSD